MKTTRTLLTITSLAAVLMWAPGAMARGVDVSVLKTSKPGNTRQEEIAINVVAQVRGVSADELGRCVAKADHRLSSEPGAAFSRMRWTDGELDALAACRPGNCKFEFPAPMQRRLAAAGSIEERKNLYYDLLYEASVGVAKRLKQHRISFHRLANERCGRAPQLYNLLQKPAQRSAVRWHKTSASSRMRPTTVATEAASWQVGSSQCVGKTLLFADHYYDDLVELYQIDTRSDGSVMVRLSERHAFDFFGSWWARRFKGTIGDALAKHSAKRLAQVLRGCDPVKAGTRVASRKR